MIVTEEEVIDEGENASQNENTIFVDMTETKTSINATSEDVVATSPVQEEGEDEEGNVTFSTFLRKLNKGDWKK